MTAMMSKGPALGHKADTLRLFLLAVGSMPNGCHIQKCHVRKVLVPYMSYICYTLGAKTQSDGTQMALKPQHNIKMPSLIIADVM